MRIRDLLSTGLRDVRRQPLRSALTVVALAISSSLFVALVTLGLATRAAINHQLGQDVSVNTIVVTSDRTVDSGPFADHIQLSGHGGAALDTRVVTRLAQLPGVRTATPLATVWQLRSFRVVGDEHSFVARPSAVDTTGPLPLTLAAGQPFDPAGDEAQLIVGQGYAKALGAERDPGRLVGRRVHLTTRDGYRGEGADVPAADASKAEQEAFGRTSTRLTATIVGVTDASQPDNAVYLPMAWAHELASVQSATAAGIRREDTLLRSGYSSILVQVRSAHDVRSVTTAIEELGYGVTSKQQQIDEVNQLSTVIWITLGAIALISMISAGLGIVNTMLMTVSEQRYAVGVWRACGATRLLIVQMFVLQAVVLGVVGGLLGTAAGIAVSSHVNERVADLLRAQGLELISISSASVTTSVAAVAGTALLAVLAGLYPALKAARDIYV